MNILDIEAPMIAAVNGPVRLHSDKANEVAPSARHTQYFEMFGDRALYHDGWIASTKVIRPP